MALISLLEAKLAYGDDLLLDKADFALEEGEKICLLGRNGTGKSTLLKVFAGQNALDDGRLIIKQGLNIARLEQDPPQNTEGTAYTMAATTVNFNRGELQKATDITFYPSVLYTHLISQLDSRHNYCLPLKMVNEATSDQAVYVVSLDCPEINMGVNWASIGAVPADEAVAFAQVLTEAAKAAREFPYNGYQIEY